MGVWRISFRTVALADQAGLAALNNHIRIFELEPYAVTEKDGILYFHLRRMVDEDKAKAWDRGNAYMWGGNKD